MSTLLAKRCLVTGGACFIGLAAVRKLSSSTPHQVLVVDKPTYAGNLNSLKSVANSERYRFVSADIADARQMQTAIGEYQPDVIMHLAAESHVDRSIDDPREFVRTSAAGTFVLLQAALAYRSTLDAAPRDAFRFHHIATDEVFGSLGEEGFFHEEYPYQPNSPYSHSKAASENFVRAWHHTYGLRTLIPNCSNDYSPYRFPEKLIPLMILNAFEGKPLPVSGTGENVHDWLYVEDHTDALILVVEKCRVGESYNIGGWDERTNFDVVRSTCKLLDELAPSKIVNTREKQVRIVADHPGHDLRYAIDASEIERELGWRPRETFDSGLRKTVSWYLDNQAWWERVRSGVYHGERLGVAV